MTQPNISDYWSGPAVWLFNPVGYGEGAVAFVGPTVFPAGINPGQTQTAAAIFGPAGGQINVPPLAEGPPGPVTDIVIGETATLAPGAQVTATLTPVTPTQKALNLGIPEGAQGQPFETEILNASDLTGTPAAGYTFVYVPAGGSTPAQVAWAAMPYAVVYNVTSIPTTPGTAGQTRTIQSITIPKQPFTWIPFVYAKVQITGTANTAVDVVARLGGALNSSSGLQVASGWGQSGAVFGSNPQIVNAFPDFSPGLVATNHYGEVAANVATTIYLNCEQQASTVDTYTTGRAALTVGVLPISPVAP